MDGFDALILAGFKAELDKLAANPTPAGRSSSSRMQPPSGPPPEISPAPEASHVTPELSREALLKALNERSIREGSPESKSFAKELRRESKRRGLNIKFAPMPSKVQAFMSGLKGAAGRVREGVVQLLSGGEHPDVTRIKRIAAESRAKTPVAEPEAPLTRQEKRRRLAIKLMKVKPEPPAEGVTRFMRGADVEAAKLPTGLVRIPKSRPPASTPAPVAPVSPVAETKTIPIRPGHLKISSVESSFLDELDKLAAKKRKMPHFTEQDRPEGVKKIYRALAHREKNADEMRKRYGRNWKEVAARIAARQGKKGKQKQGPPYKGPLGGD